MQPHNAVQIQGELGDVYDGLRLRHFQTEADVSGVSTLQPCQSLNCRIFLTLANLQLSVKIC
ncbi:MAG: hypothetical protein V7L31_07370 [Nostoc sp.]|uniref:hypothetical protein n=1 Tax=Nostoc sp. TaxID=1180 RepID=UPI002FF27C96